jgi:hypothetical protein
MKATLPSDAVPDARHAAPTRLKRQPSQWRFGAGAPPRPRASGARNRQGSKPLRVAISPISRDQLPAALRRIANSGEPHSEQWPSQPGRPFGSVTSRGSAMVTFWPQTHQLCGPGSCTSSLCGSTMCHNHILGLPASYAGRAIDGLAASRTRAPGRPLRRFRLAPEAIESVQLHADLTIRGEARVRPRKGRRYRSLRRPLLKRKTGPAGIPCASESVASARCSRLSCLCSLGAGIDGRRASSTRLLLSGHKNEGVSLIVSPDPPYGVCGEGAGLVAPHSPNPNRGPQARNTLLVRAARVC